MGAGWHGVALDTWFVIRGRCRELLGCLAHEELV